MGTIKGKWGDDEVSSIADKEDIGFIDYDDNKSVCSYIPEEEGPIVISVPFPMVNGKPRSILLGDTVSDPITIRNTTEEPVELWKVDIYDSNPKDSFTVSVMEPPSSTSGVEYVRGFFESFCLEDRVLQPHQTLTVWLSCKPKGTGLHTTAVHFDVGDDRIERLVFVLVDDKISQSLASSKPYIRDRKKKQLVVDTLAIDTYIPSARPARDSIRRFRYRLASYPIPNEVRESINNNQMPDGIAEGLTRENYCLYFSTLLNIEEIKLEEEMRGYDMECISFGKKGPFLSLEVPGLAERRPSLVYGDYVFAKLASDGANDATPPYQGHIYRVEAEEVHLKFDKELHFRHRAQNMYNVQFNYNRTTMRKQYQAIEATEHLEVELLFPSESSYRRRIRPSQLRPISPMLNEEQKHSVKMIIGCKGGAPYIIHGPPGTGKTVTIVEAILQVYKGRKDARLLVCAPSNSAADHILEMLQKNLVHVEENDILRLNALTRNFDDIKPDFLQFCCFEESIFRCPQVRDLLRYKIIISTYMSSFLLCSEGLRRGQFSHIFLDEAGQASEPETMVPLSNFCRRGTVVVLAGDPCQLGPVIHSKDAETSGLGMSYLARLFYCTFYENGDENYVTKLVRNYRCHPEILYLPSQLFYGGELIAVKSEDASSVKWIDLLPNTEFPVLFIGIQGCDEREGNNPSWFNRFEASKVVEMIRKLTEERGLSGEDIGVITPYRQQVLKVSNILESLGCSGIKVGSVEQFQGQERQVIIISTVRSTIKHNEFDRIHYLGFLSNSRRFNVAITRARSLLIIIGNPHIIGKDPHWNMLLWRCVDNGSYQGCPLPVRENFVEESPTQEGYLGCEEEYQNPTQGADLGYEKDIPLFSNDVAWGEGQTKQTKEDPKPDYDESEWADGWKS